MRRFAPPVPRWSSFAVCLAVMLISGSTPSAQQTTAPIADPNVNMVRGITLPTGDPFMQRQNEPSIAVSTRNPCHLVAGANDYRAVDIPFDNTPPPNGESSVSLAGDAWLGLFKSFDCGQKWSSTLLPGFPQDNSTVGLPLKGYEAGADPTVRAGSNGLFYYSGMVFNRGLQGLSKIFVARLIDNNNKERGDPIQFIDIATIDTGGKGQFLDKPWLAVDIPRSSFGPGATLGPSAAMCDVAGQRIPAGNVYMAWARFTGDTHDHSKLMFAKSADCGKTWKTFPLSNNQTISQGANLAIAPHDGTIYLTWREFATAGAPVNMWLAVSSDGGETFSKPTLVARNLRPFDQFRTTTKFRSNALPAITADHQNRVYVAWSETGYFSAADSTGTVHNYARIVIAVSTDRGKTFRTRYPIDPVTTRGHQMMPSLAFAAGKIQAIYYDSREDASGVFNNFIDDKDVALGSLRHTIDVRGVQANPGPQPVFVAGGLSSLEISKYRQWSVETTDAGGNVERTSIEIGGNPPNLPMYAAGTTPFMGDYIDVSALIAFPIQTTSGQVWQPNIGPINLLGAGASGIMANGFPTLPIFHATWTDNRDVQVVSQVCTVPPADSARGDRNANIYTARLTPGLFVGSPGNTKPLGFRIDPETGKPTTELMQRGFVVFAQNTTDALKFYEFHITNQPAGGKATFRQFEKPQLEPLTKVVVSIPKQSTSARTVYATSTDVNAQILVNVQEVTPVEKPGTGLGQPAPPVKKEYDWVPVTNGLRASILLNPDRTNPPIVDPDINGDIPEIATTEVHNPSMFDAQFFRHRPGSSSRQLDVKNPDPESPDPESPDPESPDPESPDPESPDPESDPENPDPESPDPESPDPESPDFESPDMESAALLNTAISEEDVQNSTITDINWRVHNSGNTTSAYRFRPVLQETGTNSKYQLIVTRRYMTLTMDTVFDKQLNQFVCKPVYKSQNHVVVNIVNFDPKAPDFESPDFESPDPESPDFESPDPESPDPESANFFLAPEETATVTLRVFTPPSEDAPTSEDEGVAARTSAEAANTGETVVSEVVRGAADLTLYDQPYLVAPAALRPGHTANVTWTLSNRGSADAIADSGSIKTRVYLSTNNNSLDQADQLIATVQEPTPFKFCPVGDATPECSTTTTTPVPMPQVPGQYFVIIETDGDAEVFEAELGGEGDGNNLLVIPVNVDAYQLAFVSQPSATTQEFSIAPAVTVAILHPDGGAVSASDVPGVTLSIQTNPSAGALAGNTTQPNVGGVATFSDVRINQVGTGYTLAANAPFSTFAISAPFNIEADAPPDAADDSHTISEDQVLTVAAPGVLTNDTDPATKGIKPAGYALHAVKQSDPNGGLTFNQDGSFTYTPPNNFTGSTSFTYQARDGRPGNSDSATVTITVNAVNDAPSFTKGADQTVAEDAGLQTVPNWATAISAGPADESGQAVDFIVTNNNNTLFSAQPAISPSGTLTYTTAPNRDGVAIVTVQLHDNGCPNNVCATGSVNTSAPQTFTINVTGANDAPVAQADAYTTREDTVLDVNGSGGIQKLLFNDTDADGNTLTAEYLTTTANGVLATLPDGSFTYTPNPNFFGTDSFTYRPFDGTTAGNTITVAINVLPVNDAPSFVKGDNQVVPMNAATQVFAWAEQLSAGPANESTQALDFIVTNDNAALFATPPAVSPTGTLSFTPRNNIEGVANVTVRVHDNGSTENGGVDTSAAQTFVITVTAAVQNFVVTNTNDSGKGSLRLALESANANDSHDVISFNISSGLGVRTITPLTPLPPIVFRVTINATTQPGFSGTPLIELNGSSAGAGANGFNVQSSNVTIRGFAINRFSSAGIRINGSNNVVAGNFIGTNAAGTAALPNGQDGVQLSGAPNLIGGSIASERNIISGNTRHGVMVTNTSVDGNAILGNYIGLNAAGAAAIANTQAGIWIEQSGKVTIGGSLAGEANIISGNGANGVHLYICSPPVPCTGATVQGNRIGTNAAGTAAIPNARHGIEVTNSPNHVIRGNLISGNGTANNNLTGNGIAIVVPTPAVDPLAEQKYGNHIIAGNLIGTNAAGSAAIPNLRPGISLAGSTKARIGGTTAADRNVISFNGDTGVFLGAGTTFNNTVQGNYIGLNAAGTQAAPNQGSGVYIANGSTGNVIGGSAPGAGNVIGGNAHNGVSIVDTSSNNVVEANFIGVSADGASAFPNQLNGVSVDGVNNLTTSNRIANNTNSGVIVNVNGTSNRITQNSIYNNGLLGIELLPVGVTPNDAGDADNGANRLQNFPVISAAHNNNSATTVIGTLNSTPTSAFTIELFSNVTADGSGNGEGRTYLTSLPVTTDAGGNATFTAALALAAGQFVTATATDSTGNTSEFSNARLVVVNTAPTTNADSATTAEDTSVPISVLANDTDADTDTLSVASLVQPANGVAVVQANGTITYAPNANFFGSDSFTYRAVDSRGGLSQPATVNVSVTAVNDPPSFTKGPDQVADMNSGQRTVPNWATNISAGPFETTQTVTFVVSNDNNSMFSAQPTVSSAGTLTFTPAAGVAGSALVSLHLMDNGGTNPGINVSSPQSFLITVNATAAATFVVTNTNDSGNGSLRQALLNANATSFADLIRFDIAGGGVEKVIVPATPLPVITGRVFIDGTTQPGYDGKPVVRLHGNGIANGLETATDVFGLTVKGLSITGFTNAGLNLLQAESQTGHVIEDNLIGTNRNETAGSGNGTGIVLRTDNSTITRNVLSGNTASGIRVENDADNVTISNNKIGTTFNGLAALPNGSGVVAFGTLNNLRIESNVISANTGWGIDFQHVQNDPIVNARIRGNTIGLFADGSSLAGNGSGGVKVDNARGTLIGEADQPPNVISGNGGPGIHLTRTASPLPMPIVQHNYIGTDSTGMLARGNALGILVSGTTSQALIGGTSAAARNVISGNIGFGIEVDGSPTTAATTIQGNFIGLAADGSTALGNGAAGIKTTNAAVMVGGTTSGARNVIAANLNGLSFSNSGTEFNSFVYGNYFGTDVTGSLARGGGIAVSIGSAPGTRVGGDLPGQGNLFAGSTTGVSVSGGSHPRINNLYNSVIQGNTFGLSATGGSLPLGNAIAIGNSFNLVGGSTTAARNIIANSTNAGVVVSAGEQNSILGNSIHDNGSLGIDLNDDGVTPNDDGDGDTGANTKQNFPVITSAITTGEATLIAGSLNSLPNQTYRLELFRSSTADPSGHGEGQQLFSSLDVTTDATGNTTFSDASGVLPAGTVVTATATNSAGNTSEFSAVFMVPANTAPIATADSNYTISGQEATFAPAANDLDPDVASPQIRATYQPTGATPVLTSPGDVAIVSSTGIGYFTGGNLSAATDGKIGILNLATNTVGGAIQMTGNNASTLARVSQSTRIAYMRTGAFLQAIDGRSESPTFNQSILNVFFGPIQSMTLNETTKRLYATVSTTAIGLIPNGRVVVVDIDPTSPTFHQVLDQVTVPSFNGTTSAIAVNPATNKVYVGASGGQPGVWVINGSTHAIAQVTGGSINTPQAIAVNDLDNLIYVIQGSNLHAIDGVTDALIETIPLPANAGAGNVDTRIAIHRANGKVFVRLAEFPNPSRLVVVDGKRTSPTFNDLVFTQNLGRENSQTIVAIDEAANRLITTSTIDHETHILDATNHDLLNTIESTQNAVRASIDLQTHRAYVIGAIGHLQVINLTTAQLISNVQVGVDLFGLDVDTSTHSAYLAQTGATTAVVRLNDTGVIGTVPLPHVDGRETYLARNGTTNKVYVLNSGAIAAGGADALPGFVHVIDGVSNAVTASVPVGAFPFGLAVDPVSNKVYVGNSTNGAGVVAGITVINGVDNSTAQADLSQIPLAAGFSDLGVGRDLVPNTATGKLYFRITAGSTTQLGVLNGLIGSPLPNFGNVNIIRVNSTLNRVYVGAQQPGTSVNQIHVLNGATDQLITTLFVGFPSNFITNQSYLAVNPNNGRFYVADFLNHQLDVFDGATNEPIVSIPVGRGPGPVAINTAANRIYVGNAIERSLTIIDGVTNRVVRTLALPLAPVQITVDDTLTPARLYIHSTANEAKLVVVDDPGTSAPAITAITQPGNGTAVLNADGTVTYNANAGFSGTDSYTYTTDDGNGGVTTATAFVTVAAPLNITTATVANGVIGVPYSQTFTTSGGTGAVSWFLVGTLPAGLTITPAGTLSGTPLQAGTFSVIMQARDSGTPPQVAQSSFTILIGPPAIAPGTLTNGTVNVPFSQQLFLGGGVGNVTWLLDTGGHPALAWLSLSNAGVLSGTHTTYGNTPSFTVTAVDSTGQKAQRTYTIFFNAPLDLTPMREGVVLENPPSLPIVGGFGTRTATLTSAATTLPPGVTLNSNGSFTGQPLRHGTYNFTVELRDCTPASSCGAGTVQQVVTRNVSWRISAREQLGNNQTNPPVGPISFGGPGGPRLAQVITAGAHGSITAVGIPNNGLTCPTQTPLTFDIQRLTLAGLPDGITLASGTATTTYNQITLNTPVPVSIGTRLAVVVSSPLSCSMNNAPAFDFYNGGQGYIDRGAGWLDLFEDSGRYDLTSVRTLIQPAMDVTYLFSGHGGTTATMLTAGPNSGKVLIAGNSNGVTAELFDPETNIATTTGNLTVTRQNATATSLANGSVLIVGGRDNTGIRLASAEIYNPVTGVFTSTAGSLATPRENHRAVRFVVNGAEKVLITGGQNSTNGNLNSAEVYDPLTGTFSAAPNMLNGRQQHIAVLLDNNKILVAGGFVCCGSVSAETYDPATNTFTATTGAMIVQGRGAAAAAKLFDGKVLITGGQSGDVRAEAELYDPATNAFTAAGSMLSKRYQHTATLSPDGTVLIAGGLDAQSQASYTLPLATLERYIPGLGFVDAGSMEARRAQHAAVRLSSDKTLLVGGFSQSWMTNNTAELFSPTQALSIAPPTLPDGTPGVAYAGIVLNASGGTPPYQISHVAGPLPPGMSYTAATRTLAGTPTAGSTGLYVLGFEATDAQSNKVAQSYALRIGNVITITSPYGLPNAAMNAQYFVQLTSTGVSPVVWSLAPAALGLPAGLTLGSAGAITGIPTQTGFFSFAVRATGNDGQQALKVLSISVQSPLTITTTSLNNVDLFGNNPGCVSASNGTGTRFWDISLGALPQGLTINSSTGCINGSALTTGTFTFTVRVTDQSSPPQVATREFTINSWAMDQNTGSSVTEPPLTFGGTIWIGERVFTGVSGTLRAVRIIGASCPAGTLVTAQIQGVRPDGAPDGTVLASGQGTMPLGTIVLSSGIFFAADAQFTLVFSSDQNCTIRPHNFDSYPGTGYVATNISNWQTLLSVDGRHDLPFVTLVEPVPGLIPMSVWRGDHAETRLPNGKILLTGGNGTNHADLFDPVAETVAPVVNSSTLAVATMTTSRSGHTATLLGDGNVLIAGGYDSQGNRLASAEIYNPGAGTFTSIASMETARQNHTATLLPDGNVLIAGGSGSSGNLQSAELFQSAGNAFVGLGNMLSARNQHTATLLDDGRVLLAGGFSTGFGPNAELYNHGSMTFAPTDGPMVVHRGRHTATLLTDGKVLLAGGTGNGAAQSSAEVFDPATGPLLNGTFASVGQMQTERDDHTATRLDDGSVLVAGGLRDTTCCNTAHEPQATMERYLPGTGWVSAGSMRVSRYNHTATLLGNGRVLLAGTWGWSNAGGRMAETYEPATALSFVGSPHLQGTVGEGFSHELIPSGGTTPRTVTHVSGLLPPGLNFLGGPPRIAGTPSAPGTFTATFSITDGSGQTAFVTFTIRINPVIVTTSATLPNAYNGVAYSATLTGSGVGGIVKWEVIGGSLPNGLSLNQQTGEISGTPTVSCCGYFFTVRATDSIGQTGTKTVVINVQEPLTITTTTLVDGFAGNTYFGCIFTNGGTGNRTFSLSGNPPAGLSIDPNNGCFNVNYPTDVIRQGGEFSFTVHVQDSGLPPQQDTQAFTIRWHADDQQLFGSSSANVPVTPARRVAQVYRSSSPYPLTGVQVFGNLMCEPSTQVTFEVRTVIGQPPRPDTSGTPLATSTLIANSAGFLNSVMFASPVEMPQGSHFAVVASISGGNCTGQNWPVSDFYRYGTGWVDDGAGWTSALTAIGRYDIPFSTTVLPFGDARFLSTWRGGHTTAALADGRVLLIGPDDSAEVYDPDTQTLTSVGALMDTARHQPTATRLNNGKVLIVGGSYWNGSQQVASAETLIFDPAGNGSFQTGPALPAGRFNHEATRLDDGRVLVTGGWSYDINGNFTTLDSALVFDVTGGSYAPLTMTGARVNHTATLTADGKVVIIGGFTGDPFPSSVVEVFDPTQGANGTFSAVSTTFPHWPSQHTATLLTAGPHTGSILVTSGSGNSVAGLTPATGFFNLAAATYTSGPALNLARYEHAAARLPDHRIAIAGGIVEWETGDTSPVVEVYDPLSNLFTVTPNLTTDRQGLSIDVVDAGGTKLAVSGGWGSGALANRTIELLDVSGTALTITTASLPDGTTTGAYPATLLSASGGTPSYAFTVAWGSLPPGLTLASNGNITGTPTAGGVFEFAVQVTDSASAVAYRALSITVDKLTILSNSALPDGVAGAFYSHQLEAAGSGTVTWSLEPLSTLPGSLTLSSSGLLSGTGPAVETFASFTLRATDASNQTTTRFFTIHFSP